MGHHDPQEPRDEHLTARGLAGRHLRRRDGVCRSLPRRRARRHQVSPLVNGGGGLGEQKSLFLILLFARIGFARTVTQGHLIQAAEDPGPRQGRNVRQAACATHCSALGGGLSSGGGTGPSGAHRRAAAADPAEQGGGALQSRRSHHPRRPCITDHMPRTHMPSHAITSASHLRQHIIGDTLYTWAALDPPHLVLPLRSQPNSPY